MDEQVFEGTWEEVATHADEFAGKQVRLTLVKEQPHQNYRMLEVMRRIAERDKDRPLTSADDTQRLLREARDGKMYGADSSN